MLEETSQAAAKLFVIIASEPSARRHVDLSIANPIDPELCAKYFDEEILQRVRAGSGNGQLYAWGATPGPNNTRNWEVLSPGDFVLVYQSGWYTFLSRIVEKHNNPDFARALWGTDSEGKTWQLMYFLEHPKPAKISFEAVSDILSRKYFGFTRIDERTLTRIEQNYGSVGGFMNKIMGIAEETYLLLRSNKDTQWKDDEGKSYHFGPTVANYTRVVEGASFILDRRSSEDKKLLGVGVIGKVSPERDGTLRASFQEYTPFDPLKQLTPEEEAAVRSLPGYNPQHSIHVLNKEVFERVLGTSADVPRTQQPQAQERPPFDLSLAVQRLVQSIDTLGFYFEPWQIASYVAAVRTKPFVILAGITGTGKSKLPIIATRLTGGRSVMISVRPDWTDSSDVIGYENLEGNFRPGVFLRLAREATENKDTHFVCIFDEMNLARVEQYLPEVLSVMEEEPGRSDALRPLISYALRENDREWTQISLPNNLSIVGTVNMDETTHGFSRKVLDRAFTIELSDPDLSLWGTTPGSEGFSSKAWPAAEWRGHRSLATARSTFSESERSLIGRVIGELSDVNRFLSQAQLHLGYRARDEIALFVLHASEVTPSFVTRQGIKVDPLDVGIQMKVLPRIAGGSAPIRHALMQLLGWSRTGTPATDEEQAQRILDDWSNLGRPNHIPDARYPRTAARLCLMWERITIEGFASFWL